MKKYLLGLTLFLMVFSISNVNASVLTMDRYKTLGLEHVYVVGDYMFNSDYGFSPSLKDYMKASRTIPLEQDVYVYDIQYIGELDYFSCTETYTRKETFSMPIISPKYIYKSNIATTTEGNYEVIS